MIIHTTRIAWCYGGLKRHKCEIFCGGGRDGASGNVSNSKIKCRKDDVDDVSVTESFVSKVRVTSYDNNEIMLNK